MYNSSGMSGHDERFISQSGSRGGTGATYSACKSSIGPESSLPGASSEAPKVAPSPSRIRRRNRAIQSCLECRRRKLKCDKQSPCTNCTRFRRACLYLAPATDPQSQQKLAEIKEKMGALEENLEREVAQKSQKAHLGGVSVTKLSASEMKGLPEAEDDDDDAEEDEDRLEPTPLADRDNVYEDSVDDELMDLGVQMGKMRISERIGGWLRPKLVEELSDTLEDVKAGKLRCSAAPTAQDHHSIRPGESKLQASPKSYMGPGPDYIAPASSFFFPGTNANVKLIDYLPGKNVADSLIQQYWTSVHYLARTVHRPTFEAQYILFWGQIGAGHDPTPSVQAIMFAAMFSAAVSMTNEQTMRAFGTTKNALVDSLRSGTELALAKANFLRTTRVDTMQAFTMYLIPLVRSEVSRAHSALVGTAIRLAECMGLHRDGTLYNMSPTETHVRRMIWHQLCFLDMRTCEATGPRPQIRTEDYDTRMPLNVDDNDLLNHDPPTEDKPVWTDMTFSRLRFENSEKRRQVWYDILQVDRKKKSLTSVLVKVQRYRTAMEEKFWPMIDNSQPFQVLGRMVYEMGARHLHLQVLHRYLFSTTQRMPDRLRQVLIEAGLVVMEYSIAFETNPEMQAWTWYRGAFNQYHAALLLMIEIYAYPMRKEAARIWKCLDYIFEIPPHLAPKQKAELVLTDLRDRMEVYRQMRKVKVSNQMEQRVGRGQRQKSGGGGGGGGSGGGGSGVIDELGQMMPAVAAAAAAAQDTNAAVAAISGGILLPPMHCSPPPPLREDSNSTASESRHGSLGAAQHDGQMSSTTMDDIDWADFERVFPSEIYTGDLNIRDFNMTDFTGSDFASTSSASNTNTDPNTTAAAHMQNLGLAAAAAAASSSSAFGIPVSAAAENAAAAAGAGAGGDDGGGGTGRNDLSDVQFTPTLIPNLRGQWRGGGGGGGGYAARR
ncbi:transcriptional regulatory [Lecanosticta acicola]|uniref:Transcriptional regulatory n=1 Tax=Lecanosticta acicola TaxID=111012 RepID=A0AAI9EAJ6_9PEZI|nr:transcriptional regulatory [Lecanosticta acicola]